MEHSIKVINVPVGKFNRSKNHEPKMGIFHSINNKFGTFWSKILIWIRIQYEIRVCHLEKSLKINKRAGMFIPHSRVNEHPTGILYYLVRLFDVRLSKIGHHFTK